MMQIIPMTDKQKLEMYMNLPQEEVCKMLIECNKIIERMPVMVTQMGNSKPMTGIELIAQERLEQVEKHGRTLQQDVEINNHYQLSEAAGLLTYVDPEDVGGVATENDDYDFSHCCPTGWDEKIWHHMMNKPYLERMQISGAFCAAEIDRMQAITKDNG